MTGGTHRRRPWNETGTASIVSLRPMLTYARTRGVDVESVLREIGLATSALDDYDERISEAKRAHVWVEVASRLHDPSFGLEAAATVQIGAFDVLDYALYFSKTLDDGLGRICRFHRVLCDAWAVQREVEGHVARLRRVERTPPPESEAFNALLVLRARELTGVALVPHEIRFCHAAPADTTRHAALFRCPVRFDSASTEIVFEAASLALPVLTANPGVDVVLDRYMTEMLGRLPRSQSFIDRVRALVAGKLDNGQPTLPAIARELHASPRTVQRTLAEHGTTYAEVVEQVRRDIAERLVADGHMSITEIAFLLGFGDVSGFRRAYKRWTGVAPSRGRARA